MKRYNAQHHIGITAVEALIVLSLFVLISGVIFIIISSFYRYNAYTIAQAYQIQNGRMAVERLVRDMREMTYGDNGAYPLISYSTSTIAFYSDIDRDANVEQVHYELIEGNLHKTVYEATGTPAVYSGTPDREQSVAAYIQNIPDNIDLFTYHTKSGAVATSTTPVTDIRHIEVRLKVSVDPMRNPNEFEIRSSATLRNVESEL